jgi:hypothetical protein
MSFLAGLFRSQVEGEPSQFVEHSDMRGNGQNVENNPVKKTVPPDTKPWRNEFPAIFKHGTVTSNLGR